MVLTVGSKIKGSNGDTYILDEILGSGGFATVFKGRRESDGLIVAVKTLLNSFESAEGLLSFQRELLQAGVIDSEHVIKYYYTHNGNTYPEYPPYIIMEYANGGTLAQLIDLQKQKGELFDLNVITEMCMQLANGMNAISKSLVHRDIKPENILIKDGILKISDFGLSKYSKNATRTLTFKGYGTAGYVAPEAWGNDKNTIQMDIYSMGIVFFEIATLQYPYHIAANADNLAYRDAHLFGVAKNPGLINSDLPQSFISTIIKMMEKPTHKRFSEWDSIEAALKANFLKPVDELESVVERALAQRNSADLQKQTEQAKQKKAQEVIQERCRLVYAQYEAVIYEPIRSFVEIFNRKYVGNIRLRVEETKSNIVPEKFSLKITMPESKWICIDTEVIFMENHTREVQRDPIFRDCGTIRKNYIPQCKGRNVQAWSHVRDQSGRGFNLLLLEVPGGLYGEWFVLNNTNSGFNRNPRIEPFGFTIQELPKEIVHITSTHIYNSELSKFNQTEFLEFFADRV